MESSGKFRNQKEFWEVAGQIGYNRAMFASAVIADHIMGRHWRAALDLSRRLELTKESIILELGCGDGEFAENLLAENFSQVYAYDKSVTAITNAISKSSSENVEFIALDISDLSYSPEFKCDGVFMMGFLHHVKPIAYEIVRKLSMVNSKVVIVEPNGNNIIRKLLEFTPQYRKAGEASFSCRELITIFESNGYRLVEMQRMTFIPPFLPKQFFSFFRKLESVIEGSSILSRLCSTYIYGFESK